MKDKCIFTSKKVYNSLFIYINGILHIYFDISKLNGLKTYYNHESLYIVELHFSNNKIIKLEYYTKEKWINCCNILNKELSSYQ